MPWGDISLAPKCTINEAYNFIHANRIKKANMILRKTKNEAMLRKDHLIISMCDSALWFSRQVSQVHKHSKNKGPSDVFACIQLEQEIFSEEGPKRLWLYILFQKLTMAFFESVS